MAIFGAVPLIVSAFRARPAQHGRRRVPDIGRRTRRSASTSGGGTRDMAIGRTCADQVGARPYLLTICRLIWGT
jgi:hypothetical protein